MARSRRNRGGCTSGRFKPKKMGKGMSNFQPPLGWRPKPKPPRTDAEKKADAKERAEQHRGTEAGGKQSGEQSGD